MKTYTAKNYYGETTDFSHGQKVTHIDDDGESHNGVLTEVLDVGGQIKFDDGCNGFERYETLFVVNTTTTNIAATVTAALDKFRPEQRLCDIEISEFETGGAITNALKSAGYEESGKVTIGNLSMWGSTVWELKSLLVS
jgi:hypothetical protein